MRGHLLEFLRLAPAYAGSLLERAPFALLAQAWGGGALATYRMLALPCLLAAAALGVWLAARTRAGGGPALTRAVAVGLCVANPLTLSALEDGHPEELLGACLCVAAVLLASGPSPAGRERSLLAGALLGLAIANKEWALLAVGPVLLALPPVRRLRCLASAAVTAAIFLVPVLLATWTGGAAGGHPIGAFASNAIFQPWQVWWFLGWHGPLVHRLFGIAMPGCRTGPAWTSTISHPLILAVGFGLAGALWLQRRRRARVGEHDAVLLLALVLLLRCVLDTWDIGYYMLPFLLALLACELLGRSRRLPILTLACVVLPWLALQRLSEAGLDADAQAAIFLAWTAPLAAALALALYAPRFTRARLARRQQTPTTPAHEMTVSSFGSPVNSS
jgi:hypothetical protein